MNYKEFRVWNNVRKEWVNIDAEDINLVLCKEEGLLIFHRDWAINATIQQWTGLKDKNGRKVFEGDVIKLKRTFCEEKPVDHTLVCVYDPRFAWFCFNPFGDEEEFLVYEMEEYEVIGNIFEDEFKGKI